MPTQELRDRVYATKPADSVHRCQEPAAPSLRLIRATSVPLAGSIIDAPMVPNDGPSR